VKYSIHLLLWWWLTQTQPPLLFLSKPFSGRLCDIRSWNWGDKVKFKLSCCALSETRDWEHEGSFDMLAMVMASSQVAGFRRFPEIKMLQHICQWTNASHLERYPKKTLMPYSNPGDVLNMSRNVEQSQVEQGGMVAHS
jgi:hypothetical protein